MTTAPATTVQVEEYLARIGHAHPPEPTGAALASIHRAHLEAIPFENLTVITGRPVQIDHPSLHRKMVARHRGGYCYEHALLVTAVLPALGYQVRPALARTGDPAQHPRPRSHLVTQVTDAGGTTWLYDVGFGSGILTPIPLDSRDEHAQGAWTFRLRPGPHGLRLQQSEPQGWNTLYTLPAEETFDVDIAGANEMTSTSPTSPFTHRVITVRRDEQRTTRLLGRELTTEGPDQPSTSRTVGDDELGDVLASLGVELTNDELAATLAHTRPPR